MYRALNPGMIGVSAPFEDCCKWAAEAGFEGMAIGVDQIEEMGVEPIKTALSNHGLKPSVFGLPVEFRGDEESFQKDLSRFPDQAALAAQVGLERCSTWVLPGQKDLSESEYFALMKRRLGECARVLHDHGIRLGLEFIGPKTLRDELGIKGIGLSTAGNMLELCEAIEVPGVGLLLDAWHWHTSHGDAKTLEWMTNTLIVDVHLNDAPKSVPIDELPDTKRELPGSTGVIDLKTFFDHLREVGYDGPVHVEPFNQELNGMEDKAAVEKTGEALRKFV
ncbi:MAG: sugar phosphate isomerase/epimerase [Candidatus Omnitrophica bacterium]|nr:sugar phosphate isomerase/epimerase [Candidatus Omnitrophota bacterium]MCA9446815.1 sugar phosphate isomerase/epimerase [Candidatus Omnitrophota bacterium]